MNNLFEISKEVQKAIDLKKPIVALESTLISHGLPYPDNIKVANESINAVKDNGSVAATIGIINGKVKVGLSDDDINILAKDKNVQKVSNHNINLSIYKKENAATTVASTISIASIFGIKFFATGGIGGVHLNAEKTYDVSADLYSLSEDEVKNIPTVCGSLREAMENLDKDRKFLTEGSVFTDDQIDAYIALKFEEIYNLEHTPHPMEFEMYYSC